MSCRLISRFAILALTLLSGSLLQGAEKTPRELLPVSTVAYFEIPQPKKLIDTVVDHPIVEKVKQHPDVQKALESPQYGQFEQVLQVVEAKLGMQWRPGLTALTEGGVFVGIDLPSQGVALFTQASDAKLAEKARDLIVELARAEATRQGQPDPIKEGSYQNVTVYGLGDIQYAVVGPWLITTNKSLLMRMVLDCHAGEGKSLGTDEQFQTAYKERLVGSTGWLYADLRVLRLLGVLKTLQAKKSDNPPAEVLAGGILGAIPDAPFVTADLTIASDRISLSTAIPCDTKAVAKSREFYFGADGAGQAPALLRPKETLFSLSTYRDFASLWRHAPDLFDEGINAKFAEAEGTLKTLFGGRDFRDEILGNIEPGMQLVAARQQFPQAGITPAIKLPAGAMVVRMKKPAETAKQFGITFKSLIGFLNVVGGMNGLDPLDLNMEKVGDAQVIFAEYLPPEKLEARSEAALHYNASPTVAFIGEHFILASSKPLALELVELLQTKPTATKDVNTSMLLDGQVLHTMLTDNHGPLVAQNMLQKGHDQAAAEKEIDLLMHALQSLEGAAVSLDSGNQMLRLSVELKLAPTK